MFNIEEGVRSIRDNLKTIGVETSQIPGSYPGTLRENLKPFDPMDFIEGI